MGVSTVKPKITVTSSDRSLTDYCGSLKGKYKTNRNVLFIQVPQFVSSSFDPKVARKRGYYAFPPTGLQYLCESLKDRGLELKILDLNLMLLKTMSEDETFDHKQWLTILEDYLRSFDPFIIGISCMYDSAIQSLVQILEFLKQRDRSVVIAGGIIGTYEFNNLLSRHLCHFVVKGEGENKVKYLFDKLTEENLDSKPSAGICYSCEGDLFETDGERDEVDMNSDLVDSYSLVDIEEYHKYGSLNPFSRMADIDNSPFSAIQMSRGCRGNCTFCSVRDFMGKGVRKRPVDKVLSEMEFLITERGVKHFEWLDDDLLFFKDDFKHLMEIIIERKWDITWSANNGLIAASIDEDMMRLMRDSGCIGFKIGIETGNPEMLKQVRKPATLDAFRKVSKILERYPEIFVGGNFMIGFPDERFFQMMDSFRFFLELNLDWGAFTVCQAIRGATAFSDFEDYFAAQIDLDGEGVKNFIPARESSGKQCSSEGKVAVGLDVFGIDPESVPKEEQIREIWFTFNLVGNFINNKNLMPEGKIDKFIGWVEMAQVAYPTNPYMSLFLALAYRIKGDDKGCKDHYEKTLQSGNTAYWKQKFAHFALDKVVDDFPRSREEAFQEIRDLRDFTPLEKDTNSCW